MSDPNKYGLKRYIPAGVLRQVRQNSKFGCVLCRKGFYQYEHIDPTFEEAREHHADAICCLCGACHDAVTRGQMSKGAVKSAYSKIKSASIDDVEPPVGPLDFHDGSAELKIGNLLYSPAVYVVLKYHGQDIIRVDPGKNGEPGKISAIFTNDFGEPILELRENEWVGSLENWDVEIIGRKITVRSSLGKVALQIRLDPPGRIVLERLDMRIGNGHVIATEETYAIGHYVSEDVAKWLHASVRITRASPFGAAIEFTDPDALEQRDKQFMNTGKEFATSDRNIVMNSNAGAYIKSAGLVISSLCGEFELGPLAYGVRKVSDVRQVILNAPDQLCRFLGTGRVE
jgi:hypothetical protein